ncbi:MAG: hypothetical protein QOI69_2604, partial [Pseudonocardiales bacterium]|nr:hypothetical protein [Pseudonocardiales bacterium]
RRGYSAGLAHQIVRESLGNAEIGHPADLDD